ncbi:DNA primase small subunit [Monocercomonoides exilis]|uniref:DNA primase small subunit n=1 Tax=Monocercomonoides exilis TaxID=2049356 RepID=UPI00355975C6|nr:DNA primase small subunit [Monocercomonoides exilis]|eukprot:MONOS_2621.1-p1 / transcript=MONOS_2621.1 / gene=MONOS_2621 / organism=Monocercomonoides_exilis_PA203 / gene_product=DNA primase small subunit / transcript_product=DNA primase small subunit / location=Mono_scaffold00055:60617-62892(+) / protein_length=525 / sequence_SO=supercontig / SO=protein_coding / is_pseudo=false
MEKDAVVPPSRCTSYFKNYFPYKEFYDLYRNDDDECFTHREFTMTIDGYVNRFLSFSSIQNFREEMIQRHPYRFDLGAVYNFEPKERQLHGEDWIPLQKELVFDIDITDYDDIRTCCSGASLCKKCWPLMWIAHDVLSRVLSTDFGWNHFVWVFSGRRGMHCWVFDESARFLDEKCRAAVVGYCSVVKKRSVANVPRCLPPALLQAVEIIDKHFENVILRGMDVFQKPEVRDTFLDFCTESAKKAIRKIFTTMIESQSSSYDIWNTILHMNVANPQDMLLDYALTKFKLYCCFPRLDENVSMKFNHLLKSPWTIHPQTGLICVPIPEEHFRDFKPYLSRISKRKFTDFPSQAMFGMDAAEGSSESSSSSSSSVKSPPLSPRGSSLSRFLLAKKKMAMKEEQASIKEDPKDKLEVEFAGKKRMKLADEDEDEEDEVKEEKEIKPELDASVPLVKEVQPITAKSEETAVSTAKDMDIEEKPMQEALLWYEYAPNVEDVTSTNNPVAKQHFEGYVKACRAMIDSWKE